MKNQQGVILVMALSIMAILLSIALGFAVFIISDINKSKAVDDSIISYYAAESGAERTIFLFRKGGKEKIGDFLYDSVNNPTALSPTDKTGNLPANNSNWTIENSKDFEKIVFRQRLYNGQGLKLYFLNRQAEINLSKSITIDWRKGADSAVKMQVSFIQLRPQFKDAVLVYWTDYSKPELTDSEVKGGPLCINFGDKDLNNNVWLSDYVVEIKALGSRDADYIDNLTVMAYNDICNTLNPQDNKEAVTNITIRAVGNYHKSKQEIVVQLPPRDPFSGLLSFVLFSERDITKSY
ncbi:hypothetical protein HZA71_00625 [Candidatus Falkowbacteria bacterium]|nr:hypothetical protein [Candidatus Falkowbacteria bacterium]